MLTSSPRIPAPMWRFCPSGATYHWGQHSRPQSSLERCPPQSPDNRAPWDVVERVILINGAKFLRTGWGRLNKSDNEHKNCRCYPIVFTTLQRTQHLLLIKIIEHCGEHACKHIKSCSTAPQTVSDISHFEWISGSKHNNAMKATTVVG